MTPKPIPDDQTGQKKESDVADTPPTLQDESAVDDAARSRRDTLLMKMYDQTAQNWRELLGVRFKLLALVPTISILALAGILSSEGWGKGLALQERLLVAVLGLVITTALFVYEMRNSAVFGYLSTRARKIEAELGVSAGAFRGHPKRVGIVTHRLATDTIYITSCLAWVIAIVSLFSTP